MDEFMNNYPPGLLDMLGIKQEDLRRQQQTQGLLAAGLQLLAGSGYSPVRRTLGELAGQAGAAGLGAYQQAGESAIDRALKGIQVQSMIQKQREAQQVRDLAGKLMQPQKAMVPSTDAEAQEGGFYGEQGVNVLPTRMGMNQEIANQLMTTPAGMEYLGNVLRFQESLKPKTYTLKPGEQVVTETGEVKASVAPTPEKVDLGNKIAFVDPRTYKTISVINKDKDPKDVTTTEIAVGKNFTAEAAPYIGISQAYTKIDAAAKNKSPAGDLSLIFGYMKILDPGSVVREGEFATAQNTGSVPESVSALYNRVLNGQRLTDTQRADFLNQAQNLVRSQQQLFNSTIAPKYVSLIQSNNLNARNVVFDPFAGIDLTKPAVIAPEKGQDRSRRLNQILFPSRGQ